MSVRCATKFFGEVESVDVLTPDVAGEQPGQVTVRGGLEVGPGPTQRGQQRRERLRNVEIIASKANRHAVIPQGHPFDASGSDPMHRLTVEQYQAGGDPIRQQHLLVEQQVSDCFDARVTPKDRAVAAMVSRNVESADKAGGTWPRTGRCRPGRLVAGPSACQLSISACVTSPGSMPRAPSQARKLIATVVVCNTATQVSRVRFCRPRNRGSVTQRRVLLRDTKSGVDRVTKSGVTRWLGSSIAGSAGREGSGAEPQRRAEHSVRREPGVARHLDSVRYPN